MLALVIGFTAAVGLLALGIAVSVLGPPLVRPPGLVSPLRPPIKVLQTLRREAT